MSAQFGFHIEFREELSTLADTHPEFLLLDRCDATTNITLRCRGGDVYEYPFILQVSVVRVHLFACLGVGDQVYFYQEY